MQYPRKIYAIKHNDTNRVYVGSSHQVDKRIKRHLYELRNHTHGVEDMQADFDKYGEKYTIMILDEITKPEESFKEYEWMTKQWSVIRGKGYNYKDTFYKKYARERSHKNAEEIISLIRDSDNPTAAIYTAIIVFAEILKAEAEQERLYG